MADVSTGVVVVGWVADVEGCRESVSQSVKLVTKLRKLLSKKTFVNFVFANNDSQYFYLITKRALNGLLAFNGFDGQQIMLEDDYLE